MRGAEGRHAEPIRKGSAMTGPQELGIRIGAERVRQGYGQAEFAKLAGVGIATLQRLEHGQRPGYLRSVMRIAKALKVSLDSLVEGLEL